MRNKNAYFLRISSALLCLIGMLLLLLTNKTIGVIIILLGFVLSIIAILQTRKFHFAEIFLLVASFLGLIIITYLLLINYSKNLIIISVSFYALNFLIQINKINYIKKKEKTESVKKEKELKETKSIKKAIIELKKEIKKQKNKKTKTYLYVDEGKSFHVDGCWSLLRTPAKNIKKSKTRKSLLNKKLKPCKICNS